MESGERLVFLVEKLQKGENYYFDEFYNLSKRLVFYVCYSVVKNTDDAEDLLQDTYIEFLNHIKRVNPNHSVMAYLLKIAKNKSLNFLKKHKRKEIAEFDNVVDPYIEDDFYNSDLVLKMKKMLKSDEFMVVILHVVGELKHKEIAEMLGKPLGTITYIYKMAIDKLRRELSDD